MNLFERMKTKPFSKKCILEHCMTGSDRDVSQLYVEYRSVI